MPRFGALRLDAIQREELKQFLWDLRLRGLAKNTIRLAATTLRAVLNAGIEDRIILHNPAHGLVRFVRSEKPTREAASPKPNEVERLLCAAKDGFSLRE